MKTHSFTSLGWNPYPVSLLLLDQVLAYGALWTHRAYPNRSKWVWTPEVLQKLAVSSEISDLQQPSQTKFRNQT